MPCPCDGSKDQLHTQVGRGGLGERTGADEEEEGGGVGDVRDDPAAAVRSTLPDSNTGGGVGGGVTESRVIWKPSEAEQAMSILLSHFERRCCFSGPARLAGGGGGGGGGGGRHAAAEVLEAGRRHLSCLKAQRKLLEQVMRRWPSGLIALVFLRRTTHPPPLTRHLSLTSCAP